MALVAVHRILVQAQQQIQLVAVAENVLLGNAEGQENMAAADDGLIGVVGAEVQPAADHDAGQNIAGGGDTLSRFASDAHCEIVITCHRNAPTSIVPQPCAAVAGTGISRLYPVCAATG